MYGINWAIAELFAIQTRIKQQAEEAPKMKKIIIENIITDVINVDALKELDKRPATCDWVAVYRTSSGLIARLASYNENKGYGWTAGFKYVNPSSHHQKNQMYFEAQTHALSIKKAISDGREVLLFNNEQEFITWIRNTSYPHGV